MFRNHNVLPGQNSLIFYLLPLAELSLLKTYISADYKVVLEIFPFLYKLLISDTMQCSIQTKRIKAVFIQDFN